MRRVLVLGGAGLVGSHLIDRLLAGGDGVTAVDDLSRGSFANLAHLKRHPRFVFHEQDVAVPYRAAVDRVYHLALPSTRAACGEDPVRATITCVSGTLNALEIAAASGARLVLATASERWGAGIQCAESLAADFAAARHTDVSIVRVPSTYGPRLALDGEHLVTTLVLRALRGEHVVLPGPIERRVRLAYVDDVVQTLVTAMETEDRVPAVDAPSVETGVTELARRIAALAGLGELESAGDPLTERLARTVRWFEGRAGRRAGTRESGIYACDGEAASPTAAREGARARAG